MIDVAPSGIVVDYLEGLGLVGATDTGPWPAFTTAMPDGDNATDNCVAVLDVPPEKDGRISEGTVILHYGLSIIVRASTYDAGWAKLNALVAALDTIHNSTVIIGLNTYTFNNATRRSGINALGMEPGTQRRFLFDAEYTVTIERD